MKGGCNEPDSLGHALALVEVVGMIPGAPIFWALALSIALNAALGWAYLAHTSRRVVLRDHLGGLALQLTPLASRSTPRDRNTPR